MSLKYGLLFLSLAFGCAVLTVTSWEYVGWFAAVFLYPAGSFLWMAAAYAGAGPGLLLKNPLGRHSLLAWVILGPYFLLNLTTFGLFRLVSRESAYVEVAPNVLFGRRLTSREAKGQPWAGVLDLAGEFTENRQLRLLPGYKSLPVLDATAPGDEQLKSAVDWIRSHAAKGPVYVHCALGHGRSACVVVAYLLATGEVETVEEGVRRLRSIRPGVRLHSVQREQLRAFEGTGEGRSE
jgi:hypothetical protein